MADEDALFRLVKTLTKPEKRYFKTHSGTGGGDNIYIQLYDTLNGMERYDESFLRKKFPNNLPAYKKQLFNKVLSLMRDYHRRRSKTIQIKELLIDAGFLFERSLYEACNKKLKEAEKLADSIEDRMSLLEIKKLEQRLIRTVPPKERYAFIRQLTLHKKTSLNFIDFETYYYDLCDIFLEKIRQHFELKGEEARNELMAEFPPELFKDTKLPQSPRGQRYFFLANAFYNQLLGNFDDVYEYFSKVMTWWNENASIKEEFLHEYIFDVSNYLYPCFTKKEFTRIEEALGELEKSKSKNDHTEAVLFQVIANNKLRYYLLSGKFEEAKSFIPIIKTGLQKHKIYPGALLALFYNIIILYFILEDFEQLRQWNQNILQLIPNNHRQDVQKMALLLENLSLYELEGEIEATNGYKMASNAFKKSLNTKKGSFEFNVLDFFKKLANTPLMERKTEVQAFLKMLQNIGANGGSIPQIGLIELTIWAESRVERQPIATIIKKYM